MIALQKPDATLVAGFKAWQTNFNRHVNKGEKGIRILAPVPYKIKEERDKLDPVTGEVMFDNDMEKTRELAEHIYYEETEGNQGAALAAIDAQAEIDALPDTMIGLWEMEEYGYTWEEMLPFTKETALELFDHDLPVYQLREDGSETLINEKEQITEHEGIFNRRFTNGIHKERKTGHQKTDLQQ